MMEFNHFNLDLVMLAIFIMFMIGIQVVEFFWKPDIGWQRLGIVKHIYIYPIEGGLRKELPQVDCTKTDYGLTFFDRSNKTVWKDRKYLIYSSLSEELEDENLGESTPSHVNPEGEQLEEGTQQPEESTELETVDLHNPNFTAVHSSILKYIQLGKVRTVKYPDGTITYIRDCGYEIARILAHFCGKNTSCSRLGSQNNYVRSLLSKSRKPNRINGEIVNYNYLNPEFSMCTLVNEESVQNIKRKSQNDDFTHLNFRPNFVIEDCPRYREDEVKCLKIGSVEFNNMLPCAVGKYVNIDPEAGTPYPSEQPYSTLLQTRKLKDVCPDISKVSDTPVFGITLDIASNGTVKVGDVVFAKYSHNLFY